jgi:hypothetical protein
VYIFGHRDFLFVTNNLNNKLKKMTTSFFSEQGLTLTSANHIANLAKEFVKSNEQALESVSFYSTELSIIGNPDTQTIHTGWQKSQLESIPANLNQIAEAHALIAWLREAIKAHAAEMKRVEGLQFEEYAQLLGYTVPEQPVRKRTITEDEYIESLPIKERNKILSLQSYASVIGKYIHPDGTFADARKDAFNKASNPTEVKGNGRDTLIYHYTPTVESAETEKVFYELQQAHRSVQAELNGYLHKVSVAVMEDNDSKVKEYNKAMAEYRQKMTELTGLVEEAKLGHLNNLRQLRIAIPNELKGIYEIVSALGKK